MNSVLSTCVRYLPQFHQLVIQAQNGSICHHLFPRRPPRPARPRLRLRAAIEPKRYPVATLLFQAVGSLVLAAEAVCRAPAHVLIDTTGLHFCLPLLRLLGVPRLELAR